MIIKIMKFKKYPIWILKFIDYKKGRTIEITLNDGDRLELMGDGVINQNMDRRWEKYEK